MTGASRSLIGALSSVTRVRKHATLSASAPRLILGRLGHVFSQKSIADKKAID
jgi:hypothetical protein